MSGQPAVFLDRDGTMIHDAGYLSRLEELRWYPWTVDAIRLLNRAGFLVFVTTNQGGVGLGLYEEQFVHTVHELMARKLAEGGARVDGWFYCPHHPRAVTESLRIDCDCRKPKIGMVQQAQRLFEIDLPRSFVVGDKKSDVGLGVAMGGRGVLVRTGQGQSDVEVERRADGTLVASFLGEDLMAATSWILAESGHPREVA